MLALAAMALNFLLGFTGVLSFGHAAYFGLGAYGVGHDHQISGAEHAASASSSACCVGTIAAAIIGPLIMRLRGVYFAMVHHRLRPGVLFHRLPLELGHRRRRRPDRLDAPAAPSRLRHHRHLGNDKAFYYFVLAFFAVAVGVMALLLRSPFGRTLLAIRENERRARFLGIPVDRHIWMSWVISCCFVSLAGTLYALLNNFVDPRALRWDQSGNFVIMAVLGGMRSFWGPLIGAAIFVVLQDYLSSQTENWMSFIGLFFVLVVLFFPRGVLGIIRRKVTS